MLFPCRCRLDLDGVAVLTLLLDLALILFSGSDLVFSEILDPSVLALSLVLDLTLVVGLILAPALILELVLVLLVFGLRLALVLLWVLVLESRFHGLAVWFWFSHDLGAPALARGSQLFQDLVVGFWLSHSLAALASCWWFLARSVRVLDAWGRLFGLGFLVLRCPFAFWSLLPYSCILALILWPWWALFAFVS